MRVLLFIILLISSLYSGEVKELIWQKGETLLTFFDKHYIPNNIYFEQSKTDKELCSEITAGIKYHILFNDDQKVEQVLIPISEEMQLHIFKKDKSYVLDIIPIIFSETEQTLAIAIQSSPYQDIVENTSNKLLANEMIRTFKRTVDFKKMRQGDHIAIKFKQRIRMGQYFGAPKIDGAMVEVRKRKYYIFKNEQDEKYYDDKARSLTNFFFKVPLRYSRISSRFTYKRFHPILKRYRAHLGIDYAAPTGRKIYASSSGKIVHRGSKGGYGKTIIIRHNYGYKTLYAHLHKFKRGLKVGSRVKQGQLIGYVGSSGRSTGPHLHFGLYKNGRAINPEKIVRVATSKLQGKKKKIFLSYIKAIKNELLDKVANNTKPLKLEKFALKSTV